MLNIVGFTDWISSQFPKEKFYPLFFPTGLATKGNLVLLNETIGRKGCIKEMTSSITIKETSPQIALAKCEEFLEKLDRTTDVIIGDTQIVLMTALYENGQYAGTDENNFDYFKIEFRMLVSNIYEK